MTEPAVLPFELRSYLFDSSHLRDRWPRLRSADTGSKATVTIVGTLSRVSDDEHLYRVVLMVQVAGAISKPKSTAKGAKDVNYANRSCRNGRACLSNRTLHQRGDDTWRGPIVSSGKSLNSPCLPTSSLSRSTQDVVDHI
jgi:hypothetical protein